MEATFPMLRNPQHADVRIKSVARQVYLCVKKDDSGANVVGTKTLSDTVDSELDFSIYYYTTSEQAETKLVLLVHQATKTCLSFTRDKKLEKSELKNSAEVDMNMLDGLEEDPLRINKADNRFFYIKSSGSNYAFEAMNGFMEDYNHFLCVTESNTMDVKKHENSNYPEDLLFSIEHLDDSSTFVLS
ncbi:uncharacterized protein [Periplaneta americana]|uniref:uncharacterized protein n=1 Tax=Periplaneta americana TaxID=6978 RepID=UPI0037E7106E